MKKDVNPQEITMTIVLMFSVFGFSSFAQEKLSNASMETHEFVQPAVFSQAVTNESSPITLSVQPNSKVPAFIQTFTPEKTPLLKETKNQGKSQSGIKQQPANGSLPVEENGLKSAWTPATAYCSDIPIGTKDLYLTANDNMLSVAAPGFLINDIDFEGEALTATAILDNVDNGTLAAFANGSFTYTPNAGFTGTDSFVYRMRDASNNFSDSVKVTIEVLPPANRNPVGVDDRFAALSGTTLTIASPGFLANDVDPDGEVLTATAILDNADNGTLAAFADGSFSYTPNAGFTGTDSFVYRMRDASNNLSDSVKVEIEVIEGNRAPIGVDDKYTAVIGTMLSVPAPGFLINDIDPDGEALTATAILDNVDHGTLAAFADGSFSYTPNAGFTGTDSFVYRMRDASNNFSDSVKVSFEVVSGGATPVGTPDHYAVSNDNDLSVPAPGFLINDIDFEGEALTATAILENVDNGTLAAFANGSFTYTPNAGFTGTDSFVYRMRDASNNFSDSVKVTIEVLPPANRNPVGVDDRFAALSGTTLTIASPGFLANDVDPDGEVLTATAILDNADNGTLAAFADGSFSYTPNAGFTGTDSFVYRMRDASNNFSDSVKVEIEVIEGNRAPIGVDDNYTAVIGTTLSVPAPGFLINDIDPDGEALTATAILDNVDHGTLAAFANGSFSYTPNAGFTGSDSFVYRMRDASNNFSDSVKVSIKVVAPNQPPVAGASDIVTECTGPDGTTVTLDGSTTIDPDNDMLQYTWYENATVIAGPSDSPTAEVVFSAGVHTITLVVEDPCGNTSSDDASITIEDTSGPIIEAEFVETDLLKNFQIHCSAEDVCSEVTFSVSVIKIPELINPEVSLKNQSSYSLEIDMEKNRVSVKAPDAAAFWSAIVLAGGVAVNDGQVISAKSDKNKYKFIFDSDGILVSVEGDVITLNCTATDINGNTNENEATIPPSMLKSAETENSDLTRDELNTLYRNYPNPFSQKTTIEYKLEMPSYVNISVYDPTGRMVEVLEDRQMPAGVHRKIWNAAFRQPGIYYYRIEHNGNRFTGKMNLLRQ